MIQRNISYFNCTANQAHIGCYAVTDAHFRMLFKKGYEIIHISLLNELNDFLDTSRKKTTMNIRQSYLVEVIEQSEAIVINAEGTIHHGGGRVLLSLSEVAIELNKPVFLVNAVFQDVNDYDDVLRKLTDLNVRELKSSNYLKEKGIKHRIVLDSILEANFLGQKKLNFKNKIIITDWHKQRDLDVGEKISTFERLNRKDIVYFPIHHVSHIENNRWRGIIKSLSEAKLLITGRHHAIYLGGLAKIPLVLLPSNTHKVEGLLNMLPFSLAYCNEKDTIEEKIVYALNNLNLIEDFYNFLISHRPLTTFDVLYKILPATSTLTNIEIDNKINKLFIELSKTTIEKEISNSLLPLKTRIHHIKRIDSLKSKEENCLKKISILESRIKILGEGRKKLIEDNKKVRERILLLQESRKKVIDNYQKLRDRFLLVQNKKLITDNKDILLSSFQYKEWLKRFENKALESKNNNLILNLAISYHGTLNYEKAIIIWNLLIDRLDKVAKKNLARIYIELNDFSKKEEIFIEWNEYFSLLLAEKKYQQAWSTMLNRPMTKKLFLEKTHILVDKDKDKKILIFPDGGIGDELRNSVIYEGLCKIYHNITIVCEDRLFSIFQINFPLIKFIEKSKVVVEDYDRYGYIYDFFHILSPFKLKSLTFNFNVNLKSYWSDFLNKKANGRKIIGICQGTHIHSYDRVSNIFPFELWQEFLENEFLFVNLSLEYTSKNKEILVLPLNYKDDFEGLGSIISSCDYIITPSNTILDFCGVIGTPTVALYMGYKFDWRIDSSEYDKFFYNIKWVGIKGMLSINTKKDILELAFLELNKLIEMNDEDK